MKKFLYITIHGLSYIVLLAVVLPLLLSLLLQIRVVQNFIVDNLTDRISRTLGTRISVEKIDLDLFYTAKVTGFFVEDPVEHDTLLYAKNLTAKLQTLSMKKGLSFDQVVLRGGKLYLNSDSTLTLNMKYITQQLKKDRKKKRLFRMNMNTIQVDSLDFEFRKYDHREIQYGINFQDMRFNDIAARISNFRLITDSIDMQIDSLSFTERSGFRFQSFSADRLTLSPNIIQLEEIYADFDASWAEINRYAMHFSEWNMSDYLNRVVMEMDVKRSHIDFSTLSKFSGKRHAWNSIVNFSGTAEGTVAHLRGKARQIHTHSTVLKDISFELQGLPDIRHTIFDIEVPSMHMPIDDIGYIVTDFTNKTLNLERLRPMSFIQFRGTFHGILSDYESQGVLSSELGDIAVDVRATPLAEGLHMQGNVQTPGFHLGELLSVKKLGEIALNSELDLRAEPDRLEINTRTGISRMFFNGYDYSGIEINGDVLNKTFTGKIGSADPNIDFRFDGYLAIEEKIPHYDFQLDIENLDLFKLNFDKRDSVSRISARINANGYGNDIDNLNGLINIDGLRYISTVDTVHAGRIQFTTNNDEERKHIRMVSDFADLEIQGQQSYNNIFPYFKNTIRKFLPSLQEENVDLFTGKNSKNRTETMPSETAENSYYIATLDVKQANNVAGIFIPGLNVAEGTRLSFMFNPGINQFSYSFDSEYIKKGNTSISGINVDSRSLSDSITLFAQAKEIIAGRVYLPNVMIQGSVKNDNINLYSRFSNPDDGTNAYIGLQSVFGRDPETGIAQLYLNVQPSRFMLGEQTWHLEPTDIVIDTTGIDISHFTIASNKQQLQLDGKISRSMRDTLSVTLSDISLAPLTSVVSALGYRVDGLLNGNLEIASVLNKPYFISMIGISRLSLNDHTYPDALFRSQMSDTEENKLLYTLVNADNERLAYGYLYPKQRRYSTHFDMKGIDLSVLNPLLRGIGHDTGGNASVSLHLSNLKNGTLSMDGKVNIAEFNTTLDFTRVRYSVKGEVDVTDNRFVLQNGILTDPMGNHAPFEAELTHRLFKNVHYSIRTQPKQMLCMNTAQKDNDLFYGRIFASGDMQIDGIGKRVTMNVNAATDNQSTFFMPLSDKSTMTEADFIQFATADSLSVQEEKKTFILSDRKKKNRTAGSFDMNLNITVRPNIEAQIVIDPTIGDIIKARGQGEFIIHANPSQDIFTIRGGYEITEGSYLFTLQNVFNKHFTIAQGSTINWTGDPLQANLNVTGIYTVKTNLSPLLGSENGLYNKRVDVDCNLTLSGRLLQPDVKLGITVPGADPETQGLINSALNTEENVAMQVFWLLFANTFFANNNSTNSNVNVGLTTAGAVTGLEFLSNQLSNWISNDKFNLGINYRPKSELTSDEIELSLSTSLLKDRIFLDVEGNYDFNNNKAYTTEQLNNLSGNFAVTFLLDHSGNLRTKAFSRQITTFDENQGLQESGVGIYYKEDFNKFSDLVKKYQAASAERKIRWEEKRNLIDSLGRTQYRLFRKEKRKAERQIERSYR